MNARRDFVKKSIVGIISGTALSIQNSEAGNVVAEKKEDAFKLGIAGYTFLNFKLDESLAMMKKLDVHYLCIKDFHLPYKSTAEEIAAFHEKLKQSGVTGYAVGPIYMKTHEEIDNAFDYAKRVGVKMIVGIPLYEDLPYVEKKVKEYDMRYAIHNHGPDNVLFPSAASVYEQVKNLDARMGLCFDMGHNKRDNHDSVADLGKYAKRIFDIHLKNVTAGTKEGKTCELGRGVIDIPAFVKMLRKSGYSDSCSLEYEKDMKDPLSGISESVGYFRGVCDAGR